jgi:formiminoglutamate deiminase
MSMTELWFADALLPGGWARDVRIEIAESVIVRVETGAAARSTDERHAIGLPGLGDVHSHAFQRGMAGLTEVAGEGEDTFWTWREAMYGFLARLHPEDVEAIAAMAFAEMLEGGFTRAGEFHYLHHAPDGAPYANIAEMAERVLAGAAAAGIGVTLLPVLYAHGGFGPAPPSARQARFLNDLDGYARLLEACRAAAKGTSCSVGAAAHSLRGATLAEIKAVAALGAPMHLHIAEQMKEVQDCIAWSGARPVELLLDNIEVDASWCLVHATHMTEEETARLAQTGAVAGLCPITEANLGDGLFPARAYLAAGGRFGVGSDSNVRIDAAEEMRTLEYGQRLAARARNVLAAPGGSTGRRLFELALAGGAQALDVRAGLAAGYPADIVSLQPVDAAPAGGDAILDALIFAAAPIDCVWCAGRKVVVGGRHVRTEAIAARYRSTLSRLLA